MSESDEVKKLKLKIASLEEELEARKQDVVRFRDELSHANSRLEKLIANFLRDLKTAETLQKILVPTELPKISGLEFSTKFIPSHISGGDYFDIFEHDDPMHFGLIMASSSGYGASSLLMSIMLKLSAKMESRVGSAPHEIVNNIGNQIKSHLKEDEKIELFYGLIDRRTFHLKYCRLGRIFSLSQENSNGKINILESSGTAIDNKFKEVTASHDFALSAKDRIILCTRGIIDSVNLSEEVFGVERLIQAVTDAPRSGVHELKNQILYQVEKFSHKQEPIRDQTLVVAEVKDRVIKLASR